MRIIPAMIAAAALIFTGGLNTFLGYFTVAGGAVCFMVAFVILLEAAMAWNREQS